MPSSWRRSPIRPGWLVALLRQLTGTGRPSGLQHGWLWRQNIGGVGWGHGEGISVGLEEILANRPAPQEGEAVPYQLCFHRHVFHWGSRGRGLRGELVHHPSWSHRGSQEAPRWQGTGGGWDPPRVPQMSGCGGAFLVDTADRGGGPSL